MENDLVLKDNEKGLVFEDMNLFKNLWNVASTFAKSSLVPQNYQGKPEDCMIAIDMANRMGVSPMMVMQNLYVVKGKPSWSGQACTTLINGCGKFKNVRHVYVGEKGTDTWGCYVEAVRVENGELVKGAEVTISMAKAEEWYSKKDRYGKEISKWQTMPELMLAYRASAFFARVHCPESLMGVQLADEIMDIEKPEKPVTEDPFKEVQNDTNE